MAKKGIISAMWLRKTGVLSLMAKSGGVLSRMAKKGMFSAMWLRKRVVLCYMAKKQWCSQLNG